jgi:quercetin dioxygenase-like cupin family protein
LAGGKVHPYVKWLRERHFSYAKWRDAEGLPVITGHFVADMRTLELAPWERKGGKGVFLNLSEQEVDDAYVLEIAPGQATKPQHYMYEEVLFVLSGRGATSVWQEGQEPVTFEWGEGSMFAMPLNAMHRHFNGSGTEPARILAVTSAPIVMNLFMDPEFVFDCPFQFKGRFGGDKGFFDGEQKGYDAEGVKDLLIETNFVPDVRKVELSEWADRGKGLKVAFYAMANSTMKIHRADFEVGTYKKAHAHGPGAHIYILEGQGYSLMWKPGEEPQRYDWQEGSFISPPAGVYHQHFNTGSQPAKQLAFHRTQAVYNKDQSHQIDYEDEDPAVRRLYERELEKAGVLIGM